MLVFGSDAAFKQLTIRNCLKPEDYSYFQRNVSIVIRVGGRVCNLTIPSNNRGNNQSLESGRRCAWYLNHASLEDEIVQRKGIIVLNWLKGAKRGDLDNYQGITATCKGAMPMRLSACK